MGKNGKKLVTKTIRLDIPYPARVLKDNGRDGEPASPETVSLTLIEGAVAIKYRDNRMMSNAQGRIWKRVQEIIRDDSGNPAVGPLTLSIEQFEWLFDIMSTSQFPPSWAIGMITYVDYLSGLKKVDDPVSEPQPEEEPAES